jgi:hypothetical protein
MFCILDDATMTACTGGPLKIIGAGFGRTGTLSTALALRQLGFPCYHMSEVFANKSHLDFWWKVATAPAAAQHDWNQVFDAYSAAVDNPACCVWQELMAAYPDAKVLLTVHPGGAGPWYDSTMDTIYRTESAWQAKVLGLVIPFARKFRDMSRSLIWERSHQSTMTNRAAAIAHYTAHIERVKASVPPERLLIFTVSDGWQPLCRFLNVPVPDAPFPNVNDRAQIKKELRLFSLAALAIVAIAAAMLGGLVYGLARLLQ